MRDPRSLVLLGLMGGLFLAAMDATVLAVAMPDVVADLGGESLYAWGFTTYMLAAAVSMPVLGALSDRHGRRRFFLLTLALFVLGSIACGLAPSMPFFLAARVAQGLGGGGLLSIPFAIAGAMYEGRDRGRALGRLASVWGIASIAGPLLGAAAVQFLSWEWVFYVNIPVGLAGAALVASQRFDEPPPVSRAPVDLVGAALLMAGVAGLLLALEEGVPARAAFALVGALLLAGFFWRERDAPAPILPLRLLSRPLFLSANLAAALAAAAIFVAIAFVPRFVEAAHGDGASVAAVFPLSIAWSGTSTLVGRHLYGRRIAVSAMLGLLVLAVSLLLAPFAFALDLAGIAAVSFAMGHGMGLLTPALLLRVQNAADVAQMGVVTASQTFLRSVGGAVGIVVVGALVSEAAHGALAGIAPALRAAGVLALLGLAVAAAGFRA